MTFKVGDIVKIVPGPDRVKCGHNCYNCIYFKEHKIIITQINKKGADGITIEGQNVNDTSHCSFHPDDLRPLEINWRKRLEK